MVERRKESVQCQLWLMKECLRGGCFDRPAEPFILHVFTDANAASSIPEYDDSNYYKAKELEAFEETKAGVKGLIPGLLVQSPENVDKSSAKAKNTSLQFRYIYFLAILLEDNNGGLEVHHQNRWFDLLPLQKLLQ
uniref:Uncharacterized protein n=1 Tax=Salix viminalis TaxID=40686 RepID=A0A6N2N719_SALVM